jgi:hypothetical protein
MQVRVQAAFVLRRREDADPLRRFLRRRAGADLMNLVLAVLYRKTVSITTSQQAMFRPCRLRSTKNPTMLLLIFLPKSRINIYPKIFR